MLDEETSEEVEEDGTDTSMKRSRLSGRRARKRKEQGGGKIKEENDSQLLTNSFSQVPTPPFSLFVIGMEPCLVLEWKRTKLLKCLKKRRRLWRFFFFSSVWFSRKEWKWGIKPFAFLFVWLVVEKICTRNEALLIVRKVKGEGDKEKMVVPLLVWMDIREGVRKVE